MKPTVLCDSMNQAASYWYFVPHQPNLFPGLGAMAPCPPPPPPLWLRHLGSHAFSSFFSLRVHYRIIFKIYTIVYQAISSTQPTYLNSMLTPARHSRQLRSTSNNSLYIPRVKTKAGTRFFSVAALTVWNSLPVSVNSKGSIVSFHRCLKTYMFNAAYPP